MPALAWLGDANAPERVHAMQGSPTTHVQRGGGLCSLGIFLLFRRLTGGRPVVVVVQDARRECYLI